MCACGGNQELCDNFESDTDSDDNIESNIASDDELDTA